MLDTMTAVFKNYFTTENLIDAHFYMPQSNIRIHTLFTLYKHLFSLFKIDKKNST